jgi:hypothetical protein
MLVRLGNAAPLDCIEKDGVQQFFPVKGQRVTEFSVPDDYGPAAAYAAVLGAVGYHVDPASPAGVAWVETDNATLHTLLCDHFALNPATPKPANWGHPAKPVASATPDPAAAVLVDKEPTS